MVTTCLCFICCPLKQADLGQRLQGTLIFCHGLQCLLSTEVPWFHLGALHLHLLSLILQGISSPDCPSPQIVVDHNEVHGSSGQQENKTRNFEATLYLGLELAQCHLGHILLIQASCKTRFKEKEKETTFDERSGRSIQKWDEFSGIIPEDSLNSSFWYVFPFSCSSLLCSLSEGSQSLLYLQCPAQYLLHKRISVINC